MAPPDFHIAAFEVLAEPAPTKGAARIVANFDCEVRGIRLERCALLHREGKGFDMWAPSRHVILPPALRGPLKAAARELFEVMKRP